MKSYEVTEKSVKGAIWAVLLSVLAFPIGYITSVILGKISPDALGIYSLIWIFDSFVTTFILFGGANVIIKYLPETNKKIDFLGSYIFILIVFTSVSMITSYIFPDIWNYMLGNQIKKNIINLLIVLMPIVIFYYLFDYCLNGLMEIKTSIIIRQFIVYSNFVVFSFLFLFFKDFFSNNLILVIGGVYSLLCLSLGMIAFLFVKKKLSESYDQHFSINSFSPYLPPKFWSFTILIHFSTILSFAYDKLDQIFVVNYFGIDYLGYYFAAIQSVLLIRFLPLILGNVILPTFCNYLALNEITPLKNSYDKFSRYNTFFVVIVALICVFYSKQIMAIFGQNYVNYNLIIVILALSTILSSLGGLNSSLLVALGKAKESFSISLIQIIIQIFLMMTLLKNFGIFGIAIGKGFGVIIAQIGLFYVVLKISKLDLKINLEYKVSVFIAMLALVLYLYINPNSIILSSILLLICIFLFLFLAKYKINDIKFLLKLIMEIK